MSELVPLAWWISAARTLSPACNKAWETAVKTLPSAVVEAVVSAVIIPPGIKRGANRRRAGEDIAAGDIILHAGQRLRPQEIGLAASIGRTKILVFRKLRVALFSTGDEIRDIGEELPRLYGGRRLRT